MATPTVISREYKVMLRASHFAGDEEALRRTTGRFWQEFRRAISPVVLDSDGDLDYIEKTRLILFHDTADHLLYENGYVFRERRSESLGEQDVTLKFRHPDRYLAQDRVMAADGHGTTKFEEDIKPPFQTLYSFSTKQKISANKNLNRMNDPGRLFPGLAKDLNGYEEQEAIGPVGNFTAKEIVLAGAQFQVEENPKVQAECALIAWYEAESRVRQPAVVEFSFRYGDERENYSGSGAKRAYDAFLTLQSKHLSDWVDAASKTKTAYVYSLGHGHSR